MKQVKLEQGQLDHGGFVEMQVKQLLSQEDIQFDSEDAIVDMGGGSRFRSKKGWIDLFESQGIALLDFSAMEEDRDGVDWPFRFLLIKEIRRIGFLITA